ncbi:MAG: Secretion system C-terminal sorting domain [Bacteroidota bacterium]|jgi:hypothetical protein
MKRSYFKGLVLVAIAALQSFSLLAGSEQTWSSPVFVTLPNDGSFDTNKDLHVNMQIASDQRIDAIEILHPKGSANDNEVRTSYFKDGKVDVDIIIRGGIVRPMMRPFNANASIRIQLFTIKYITVDNISGVFEANTNPTTDVTPRLSNIVIFNGDTPITNETEGLGAQLHMATPVMEARSGVSVNASSVNASDLTLYPNPVRDGNLFVRVPESMGSVNNISVMNAVGGLVKQLRPDATYGSAIEIDLNGLSAGVYFVRIHAATGDIVKKFNIAR